MAVRKEAVTDVTSSLSSATTRVARLSLSQVPTVPAAVPAVVFTAVPTAKAENKRQGGTAHAAYTFRQIDDKTALRKYDPTAAESHC